MKNEHILNVELKTEEWQKCLDKAFKKAVKNAKVDGFRKGSVPKDVYLKQYGYESLYNDAIEFALEDKYASTIKDSKLEPVVEPTVDITKISDTNFAFSIKVITKPEVKLGTYTNLGIKKESAKVTKEEISAEIDRLREQFAEITVKKDGKLENGNTAVINFDGFVDGKPLDGGKGENYPLEIGSHTFIPGFEEGLVGMKTGDKKELNLKFPENYTDELKNKDVLFKVELLEIKERILPEINKDFFEDLGIEGVDSKETLENHVKEDIKSRKEMEIDNEYTEKCLEKASKNAKMEINPEILDDEIHRMIHQFEEQLKMQGLNMEQYCSFTGVTHEDLHKQMEPEATKRINYRYLIDAVSKDAKIDATEKEVKEHLTKISNDYGMPEAEIEKMYGGLEVVKYDLIMYKALELIKENK